MIKDPIDIDRAPVNLRPRLALALALTVAAAFLTGCGDLPDDAEQVDRAAFPLINFGTAQRVVKKTCGKVCSKFAGFLGGEHSKSTTREPTL